jgi:uncharacterized protein DUF6644
MSLKQIADSLAATPLSAALVDHFWVVPTLQSIHIIAVAFVLTGSVVLGARTFNLLGTEWTARRWGQRLLPGVWIGLAVLLLTGGLLVAAEPTRELPNQSFQLKMAMLLLAVPLTFWLTRRAYRADGEQADATTRGLAAFLILMWLAIISAARWIGYS